MAFFQISKHSLALIYRIFHQHYLLSGQALKRHKKGPRHRSHHYFTKKETQKVFEKILYFKKTFQISFFNQSTYKPGYVVNNHLSSPAVTNRLKRPT